MDINKEEIKNCDHESKHARCGNLKENVTNGKSNK